VCRILCVPYVSGTSEQCRSIRTSTRPTTAIIVIIIIIKDTKIAPVIIGALGTIKNGLDQNGQLLPGHPSVIEL
jgi:hypothetical protein